MQQTTGKTLSMVLNIAQSRSQRFGIGGSIDFQTPYGLIHLPIELSSDLAKGPN